MTTEKVRKTRTPKNYESILNGALKLSFEDRVKLVKSLKESIQQDVKSAEENAATAKSIVNGL